MNLERSGVLEFNSRIKSDVPVDAASQLPEGFYGPPTPCLRMETWAKCGDCDACKWYARRGYCERTLVRLIDPGGEEPNRDLRRARCEEGRAAGWVVGPGNDGVRWQTQPLWCGLRGCGRCDRKKGNEIKRRVDRMAKCSSRDGTAVLLTLTTGPEVAAADREGVVQTQHRVRKLIQKLRRTFPTLRRNPYAWVIEAHKTGRPHVHIVWCGWRRGMLPYILLHCLWAELWGHQDTDRTHIDVQWGSANTGSPGWYLGKYIAKGAGFSTEQLDDLSRPAVRLWGCSKGWRIAIAWTWIWTVCWSSRDPFEETPSEHEPLKPWGSRAPPPLTDGDICDTTASGRDGNVQ